MGMARPEEGGMSVERVTKKDADGHYYMSGDGIFSDWGVPEKFKGEDVDAVGTIEDILGDTYDLDRLRELAQADREGRCVVLPDGGYEDKEGENALKSAMHTCFYHNNPVTRFVADAVAEKLVRNETKMKHCEGMAKNG